MNKANMADLFKGFKMAVSKHSPEILVVTGIVGVVTSAVMACKETRRLDPVLEARSASSSR